MRSHIVAVVMLVALAPPSPADAAGCFPQPVHGYGPPGPAGRNLRALVAGNGFSLISVADTNTRDCNGDGLPADYDGDLDAGSGGGAFGYGPFAASCGHHVHGGNFLVVDFVATNVAFVVGADDQAGGDLGTCLTNGLISPSTEEDDCVTSIQINAGGVGTCTGGGDGLVWVVLTVVVCEWVLLPPPPHIECARGLDVTITDPPTVGTITAF